MLMIFHKFFFIHYENLYINLSFNKYIKLYTSKYTKPYVDITTIIIFFYFLLIKHKINFQTDFIVEIKLKQKQKRKKAHKNQFTDT